MATQYSYNHYDCGNTETSIENETGIEIETEEDKMHAMYEHESNMLINWTHAEICVREYCPLCQYIIQGEGPIEHLVDQHIKSHLHIVNVIELKKRIATTSTTGFGSNTVSNNCNNNFKSSTQIIPNTMPIINNSYGRSTSSPALVSLGPVSGSISESDLVTRSEPGSGSRSESNTKNKIKTKFQTKSRGQVKTKSKGKTKAKAKPEGQSQPQNQVLGKDQDAKKLFPVCVYYLNDDCRLTNTTCREAHVVPNNRKVFKELTNLLCSQYQRNYGCNNKTHADSHVHMHVDDNGRIYLNKKILSVEYNVDISKSNIGTSTSNGIINNNVNPDVNTAFIYCK